MSTVHVETIINAPRTLVFDLARDVDVHAETVPWTREKIVGKVSHGKLEAEDIVTFDAVHFGVRQRLTARISKFEPPSHFEDVMMAGAFAAMTHCHDFAEVSEGQTLMTDDLTFASPLGIFGKAADVLFLRRYMTNFLERRNANLKRIAERSALEEWKS
jgi:ligand-binding SRPBCC domain-containing protein